MTNEKKLNILYKEEEIQAAIHKLAEKLNDIYANEEIYLICVLKGSVMFTVDLAKRLTMPVKMEFIRLSSYGSGTKSSGNINSVNISLSDLNNKNVIIVEDIIDTGHTAKFLIDYLKSNYSVKSLKFCSLLDKKSRRELDINADYYCFDIDDKFIVGYGLDLDEQYRNLPYIGYIED